MMYCQHDNLFLSKCRIPYPSRLYPANMKVLSGTFTSCIYNSLISQNCFFYTPYKYLNRTTRLSYSPHLCCTHRAFTALTCERPISTAAAVAATSSENVKVRPRKYTKKSWGHNGRADSHFFKMWKVRMTYIYIYVLYNHMYVHIYINKYIYK